MVALGNVIFHNRNWIFPLFYLVLFIPSPEIFCNPVTAMAIGFSISLTGQFVRVITIGLVYIIRGGKDRRVYAEKLVSTGLFSHVRNPLYVGNILILAGLGVASNSIIFNCIATPLFLFFWQAIVLAEENFLRKKFGVEFNEYAARVNRWFPDFRGLGATLQSMRFNVNRVLIREYTSAFIWTSGAVLICAKHFYVHDDRFDFKSASPAFIAIIIVLLICYLTIRYLKKSKRITAD